MAVGRLPRDQRNIGGSGRLPPGQRATAVTTATVPWAATVVQPHGSVVAGSSQPVIVTVTAPVTVGSQPVRIGVRPRGGRADRWAAASWSAPGTVVCDTASLHLSAGGRYTVLVDVDGVVLEAGQGRLIVR